MPTTAPPVIRPSGTTFSQLRASGITGMIDRIVAANPAIADPTTAPTVNATGGGATGGSLPAGNYIFRYTDHTGYGETLASSGTSAVAVGATNIPRVTFPSLPTGVAYRNLYISTTDGAIGTARLYAGGITATTFDCSSADYADSARAVPTANTTDLAGLATQINAARVRTAGGAGQAFARLAGFVQSFLDGHPMPLSDMLGRVQECAAVQAVYATIAAEVAELVGSNPGTLGTVHRPANFMPHATERTF